MFNGFVIYFYQQVFNRFQWERPILFSDNITPGPDMPVLSTFLYIGKEKEEEDMLSCDWWSGESNKIDYFVSSFTCKS